MTATMAAPADHGPLARHVAEAAAAAAGVTVEVLDQAVAIALRGGPDEVDPGWHRWGSCAGIPTGSLYPGRGVSVAGLLERCRESCAVQAECLAAALGGGERDGVWGGTSQSGRLRLRNELRSAGLLGVTGEDAYVAWAEPGADREPSEPPQRRAITTAWPHQDAAVAKIVAEISDGGHCQIAMATASGKTYVALSAAAELGATRVLVLVPSLALITQTAQAWAADQRWASTPMLAVCSDTGGFALEATTDPFVVAEFVADGPGVVFATYQSSQVLVDAGVRFDLTVADEAHHLAGAADKVFAGIVRGEISTDRTLYMTATPRRFRRRRSSDDVDLVSMDDVAAFGPRVYELSLSDAVDAGVVADYRVVVAAVDRTTFETAAAHPDLAGTDPHLLAGAIAVVEAMGDLSLASCVSFHTRVERARSFARLVGAVADLMPQLTPKGPGWAGFVHGGASVRIRERLLTRLADTHTWGVLANAKALGEGVDLPELDAVAIVDPKNSETDVLQATGRALRRPTGTTKVGTVLLPVLLDAAGDPADPLSGIDERSMELVAGVLRSLRAHDDALGSRLDHTRRGLTKTGHTHRAAPELGQILRERAARGLLQSRVELNLPGGPLGDLAGAMALHLVREATASWDEAYARLELWTAEHGHCRIPQSTDIGFTDGAKSTLGGWASRQRTLHRRGLLAPERAAALEALPGWMWDARAEAWWEKFDSLADYIARHGHLPGQFDEHEGVKVGNFVWGARAAVKDHDGRWLEQFPDRIAALEALPGWSWNARDSWWEKHYEQLKVWAAEHGHASPSAGDLAPDGFDLGKWVAKERGKVRAGKRTPDQAARLRALPGWVDSFHQVGDLLFQDGLARLNAYVAEHGDLPTQNYVCPDGYALGGWVSKQRQAYRGQRAAGALTGERVARIEAVPGWTWTPRIGGVPGPRRMAAAS